MSSSVGSIVRALMCLVLLAAAGLLGARSAAARSIRDAVRAHVAQELERSQADEREREEREREQEREREARERSERLTGVALAAAVVSVQQVELSEGGGRDADLGPFPAWPWRPVERAGLQLFGRPAHLDLSFETAVHVWRPAQHPAVRLTTESYRAYTVDVHGRWETLVNFRLGFETDGHTWIRATGPTLAPGLGANPVGTAQAMALVALPWVFSSFAPFLEPVFRYESRAFGTTATPSGVVCLVAREADTAANPPACTRTTGPVHMTSTFETYLIGLQAEGWDSAVAGYLGLDIVAQRKPYQVNVDGRTLDDFLFDTRFHGKGVALGFRFGTDRGLRFGAGLRLGSAEVSLTDDLALGDVLPPKTGLAYTRWETGVSYGQVFWPGPPALQVRLGLDASGSQFDYTHPELERAPPSLSRDLFFVARVALVLLL